MEKKKINFVFDPDEWPRIRGKSFPAEVLALCVFTHQTEEKLKNLLEDAKKKRIEIQEACACPKDEQEAIMEINPKYSRDYGQGLESLQKIFFGCRCRLCKKFTSRREGSRYSVCHRCGSDMKDDGYDSFQGGREFFYKCPDCGHKESHT